MLTFASNYVFWCTRNRLARTTFSAIQIGVEFEKTWSCSSWWFRLFDETRSKFRKIPFWLTLQIKEISSFRFHKNSHHFQNCNSFTWNFLQRAEKVTSYEKLLKVFCRTESSNPAHCVWDLWFDWCLNVSCNSLCLQNCLINSFWGINWVAQNEMK